MEKQLFSNRAFLNKEGNHSNASICTNIEKASYDGDSFYGIYKLSDCSRTVEISIDISTLAGLDNTVYKLNKIIDITKQFKGAIKKLKPQIAAHEENIKAERLKEKIS